LEQDKEDYIESALRRGYADQGPEPYFYNMFPVTLSPPACKSVLRTTNLPVPERDYYLSKLFQFLYVPLEIKFQLEYPTEVTEAVEKFLDEIPAEYLERLAEFDFAGFLNDTFNYGLEEMLTRLPIYLLPVGKQKSSSYPTRKERWVRERWPDLLKRARGTDPQKVAAAQCGVSTETYKKWEQGVRPPAQRNMAAVRQFVAASKPGPDNAPGQQS